MIPRFIKRGHNNNCDVMYRQGDVSCVLPNVMGCKCWRGRPAACSIAAWADRGMKRNVNHNWHQVQGWLEGTSGDFVTDFLTQEIGNTLFIDF